MRGVDENWPANGPERIGRFQVRVSLGAGTSGVVYLVFDPHLARDVALKVPHRGSLQTPAQVERFLREARAAGSLRHPHIVPIYDAGQADGRYYLAAAYIEGTTLARALAEGRLSLLEKMRIARQIVDALSYSHRKGIVHRDVKPANILLDAKGRAFLTDFGIAHRERDEKLTQTGEILGTPAYMAPEQVRAVGDEIGPSCDQYSLGVILYEMLCGRCPFSGDPAGVLYQVLSNEPKRPSRIRPEVPLDLESVCLKAMAKRPGDRYADCRALSADLRRWMEGEPVQARPLGPIERGRRYMRREPLLAGAMLLAFVSLLAAVLVPLVTALWLTAAVHTRERAAEELRQAADRAEEATRDAVAQERRARDAFARAREATALRRQETARADQARYQAASVAASALSERALAERRKGEILPLQYAADILLASEDLQDGEANRARQRLAAYERDPTRSAARGFEWHLLQEELRRGPDRGRLRLERRLGPLALSASTGPHWQFSTEIGTLVVPYDDASAAEILPRKEQPPSRFPVHSPDGKYSVSDVPRVQNRLVIQEQGKPPRKLEGFDRLPSRIEFFPNSRRLLTQHSVPLDGEVLRLWDLETGKPLGQLPTGTTDQLGFTVALSPKGNAVAVIFRESREFLLWREPFPDKAEKLRHGGEVRTASFSPDGSLLYATSQGHATLWEVDTTRERLRLNVGRLGTHTLAFDWKRLAATDGIRTALWDVSTGKERVVLPMTPPYPSLRFSDDGEVLFVGEQPGGGIQAWESTSGNKLLQVARADAETWHAAGRGAELTLITLPRARDVFHLWSVRMGERIGPIPLDRAGLLEVAGDRDAKRFLFVFADGSLQIHWRSHLRPQLLGIKEGSTRSVSLSPDGSSLRSAGAAFATWNLKTGKETDRLALPRSPLLVLCGPGVKAHVALVDEKGMLRVREGERQLWEASVGKASCLAFSADGGLLACGLTDGGVRVWETATGKERLKTAAAGVPCQTIALDGRSLAVAREPGVEVIDLGAPKSSWTLSAKGVRALNWSRDGKTLAMGHARGAVTVWSIEKKEQLWTAASAHEGKVASVACTPDGRTVLTAGEDGRVRVWRLESGLELMTLTPRLGPLVDLALDEKGTLLAVAAADGRIRLWHSAE